MQKNVYVYMNKGAKKIISESGKLFSKHSYEKIMHIIIIQITLNHTFTVLSTYIPRVKIKILQS